MNGIERISTPFSESWIAWLMLLLIGLILFANAFQPGLLKSSFQSLFNIKERDSIFNATGFDIRAQICSYVFKIFIFALALYVVVNPTMNFSFPVTLLLCGVVAGVFVLKLLLGLWAAVTFADLHTYASCYRHYSNFTTAASFAYLPIILLAFFMPSLGHTCILILCLILTIFLIICLIIKIFRLFFTKILVSFYILLYLCSLEILPLGGAILLSSKIVMG